MKEAATERGEASRERILEIALGLFAKRGFAATPVSEICAAADIAKTSLYWHFGSKDGLLAAILERSARTQIEQIQKAVYLKAEPLDRLDALVSHLRRVLVEQRDVVRLHLSVALERGEKDPATRDALLRVSTAVRKTLIQGLEDALGRSVPNADMIAHTVLALLDGAIVAQAIDPEGTDLDRLLENMRTTYALLVAHHLQQDERGEPDE